MRNRRRIAAALLAAVMLLGTACSAGADRKEGAEISSAHAAADSEARTGEAPAGSEARTEEAPAAETEAETAAVPSEAAPETAASASGTETAAYAAEPDTASSAAPETAAAVTEPGSTEIPATAETAEAQPETETAAPSSAETAAAVSSAESETAAETSAAETETAAPAAAAPKNGLIRENKDLYYYIGGVKQTGWQTVKGNRYYFAEDGRAYTGTKKIGGKTYCFDKNGVMLKNTVYGRYLIDADGVCSDHFKSITAANLTAYVDYLLDQNGRTLEGAFRYIWKNYTYRYAARIGTLEGMTENDRIAMICRFLNNGVGPCTDFAYTLQYFCERLGYKARVVTGAGLYHTEHDWVLVEMSPGKWRHMDALYKSVYLYLKTDDEMAALDGEYYRFRWDRNKWTSTTATGTKP